MYTVIGIAKSRALRVIWTLEELGQPYEIDPQPPRSPELIPLNGTGKIPLLKTPDGIISDSLAIITYLADKHGALTYPAGSFARAHQDSLTNFINAEVDASLWLYAKHSFVLPEALRVPDVKPTALKEYQRALGIVEGLRGDNAFLAGDQLTIADILLSHCVGWAMTVKIAPPLGPFGMYLKDLRARPAMLRTLEQVKRLG